jgi:sensor domain CHASE-containing protein
MVDLTSFIMGIGLVLGVLGVVVMVIMCIQINRLKNKCKQLEQVQGHIFNDINSGGDSLNRRIDGEIDRVDRLYTETNMYTNKRMDDVDKMFSDVYRNFDSRLDKLTSKFTSPVGDKQVLKD